MSLAGAGTGGAAPGRREVVVACAQPGPFVDFCVMGLGLEVEGWDAAGGVVTSADGLLAVRVLDGEPVALEIALGVAPGDLAELAAAAAAAGADVTADGDALLVRGPESVKWRLAAAAVG